MSREVVEESLDVVLAVSTHSRTFGIRLSEVGDLRLAAPRRTELPPIQVGSGHLLLPVHAGTTSSTSKIATVRSGSAHFTKPSSSRRNHLSES